MVTSNMYTSSDTARPMTQVNHTLYRFCRQSIVGGIDVVMTMPDTAEGLKDITFTLNAGVVSWSDKFGLWIIQPHKGLASISAVSDITATIQKLEQARVLIMRLDAYGGCY